MNVHHLTNLGKCATKPSDKYRETWNQTNQVGVGSQYKDRDRFVIGDDSHSVCPSFVRVCISVSVCCHDTAQWLSPVQTRFLTESGRSLHMDSLTETQQDADCLFFSCTSARYRSKSGRCKRTPHGGFRSRSAVIDLRCSTHQTTTIRITRANF